MLQPGATDDAVRPLLRLLYAEQTRSFTCAATCDVELVYTSLNGERKRIVHEVRPPAPGAPPLSGEAALSLETARAREQVESALRVAGSASVSAAAAAETLRAAAAQLASGAAAATPEGRALAQELEFSRAHLRDRAALASARSRVVDQMTVMRDGAAGSAMSPAMSAASRRMQTSVRGH